MEFKSLRIGSENQHGRRFIVWGHQHGGRDVMWNPKIISYVRVMQKILVLFTGS